MDKTKSRVDFPEYLLRRLPSGRSRTTWLKVLKAPASLDTEGTASGHSSQAEGCNAEHQVFSCIYGLVVFVRVYSAR